MNLMKYTYTPGMLGFTQDFRHSRRDRVAAAVFMPRMMDIHHICLKTPHIASSRLSQQVDRATYKMMRLEWISGRCYGLRKASTKRYRMPSYVHNPFSEPSNHWIPDGYTRIRKVIEDIIKAPFESRLRQGDDGCPFPSMDLKRLRIGVGGVAGCCSLMGMLGCGTGATQPGTVSAKPTQEVSPLLADEAQSSTTRKRSSWSVSGNTLIRTAPTSSCGYRPASPSGIHFDFRLPTECMHDSSAPVVRSYS